MCPYHILTTFIFMLIREADYMSRRKTHEQYVAEVAVINPNIEVVGKYIDANTKILHRCKIDGYEWMAKPANILTGYGCKQCMKRKLHAKFSKTQEEYVRQVSIANPTVEVLGEYVNTATPILHKCLKHNVEWYASPQHILEGCGCVECRGEKIYNSKVKCLDTYKNEVNKINENIEVIGEYINARTPILHKCKICGCNWNTSPDNILHGYGCPICNFSHGEKVIKEYLEQYSIRCIPQYKFVDCKNIKPLPFDFYLPDYNTCIEYDGIQHFEPIEIFGGEDAFKKQQYNDNIKTNYCLEHNIRLIRIAYNQDIGVELDNFFNNTKLIKEVS